MHQLKVSGNSNINNLINEKLNLIDSIDLISNEIDLFTEKNNTYKEILDNINKKETIKILKQRIKDLQQNNQYLKNSIIKNEKVSNIDLEPKGINSTNKDKNLFSCFSPSDDNENTLFLNKKMC